MTDLMERRLAEAARQWQAEQPPPPGIPLERLEAPLRRHLPWQAAAAAAVIVVLVGGGAIALSRSGDDRTVGPSTGTPTVGVQRHRNLLPDVPWRNLPAGRPDVRHREHGQVVTPFDRVSATGTIAGTVHPGDTLTFSAVLESPTRLVLDPCPDFNIAFGKGSWHTWQLNCAQVPFRDEKGRPVLPAFRDVRFEMKVRVPDVLGEQKVLWTLDGPQQMPGFYGLVHVNAPAGS
jgi:hypothetical protein